MEMKCNKCNCNDYCNGTGKVELQPKKKNNEIINWIKFLLITVFILCSSHGICYITYSYVVREFSKFYATSLLFISIGMVYEALMKTFM